MGLENEHGGAVRLSAALGVATMLYSVVLMIALPVSVTTMSPGWVTPVLAFEFARTPADLAFMTGSDPVVASIREQMDAGNRWDMGFPFAYCGFLACCAARLALQRVRGMWIVCALFVAAIPMDVLENVELLRISGELAKGASVESLADLYVATWRKWGLLGVGAGGLALGLFVRRAYVRAAIAALTSVSVLVCRLSDSSAVYAEAMLLCVTILFVSFTIASLSDAWRLRALERAGT